MIGLELNFLHGVHTRQCAARVDKHFRGYCSLQYMIRGGVSLSYDQQTHELTGQWFWSAWDGPHIRFHPGAGHDWWEHRYVAVQGPLADRWQASGLFPKGPQPAPRGCDHAPIFDQMVAMFHQPQRWRQLRAINLLEGLLLELAEARQQAGDDPDLVRRVDAELGRSHYAIDYAGLAQAMGMGLSTLRRRFALATGRSLHAYVLDARLDAARRWLRDTDRPIKSIATQLGYRDVYYFSRQFREKAGVPPGVYRASRQA